MARFVRGFGLKMVCRYPSIFGGKVSVVFSIVVEVRGIEVSQVRNRSVVRGTVLVFRV